MNSDSALIDRLLRDAVRLTVARAERRRRFPAELNVCLSDGRYQTAVVEGITEHCLRVDVAISLLNQIRPQLAVDPTERRSPASMPLIWISRSGDLDEAPESDHQWVSTIHEAGACLELVGTFACVTRWGWHQPETGRSRRWTRARPTPRHLCAG